MNHLTLADWARHYEHLAGLRGIHWVDAAIFECRAVLAWRLLLLRTRRSS